jgi:ABC-type transport system substrate-binding protein
MRLAANTAYWDAARIPQFAELRLLPRAQSTTRLAMVRSGEADMAFIDPRSAGDARAANLRILTLKGGSLASLSFFGCWQEQILCHQTAFREAMVRAIDMDAIVKATYPAGTAERTAMTFWTPTALGFDPQLKPYAYDPKRAAALLKQVGYRGTPVKLWAVRTNSAPESPEIIEMVEGYLRAAGFKTEVTPMEFGAFRPRYASNPQRWETTYAAHLYIDSPGPRPTVLPNLQVTAISQQAGGLIQAYWNLPKLDAAWKKLVAITRLEDLDHALRDLNREMYSEFYDYPVALRNQVAAVGPRVDGWSPSSYGFGWHLETVTRKQ